MPRPRQIFPRQFYLISRRSLLRMYLLRPSAETNRAFVYCLAVAAQRCNVEILLPYLASNHEHIILFDPDARVSEFMAYLHKLFARCTNARLGRWEALWSPTEPCLTRLLDRQTVIDKLIYTAANPVKDLLVERAHQWPGINGYANFIYKRKLRARRPAYFFSPDGVMPETVELALTIPAELGDPDHVIAEVKAGVEAVEQAMRDYRAKSGKRVLGVKRICEQPLTASPSTEAPRRNLRPRFAGKPPTRIRALLLYKEFLADYQTAHRTWRAGRAAIFPAGTLALARTAPITVRPPPDPLPTI